MAEIGQTVALDGSVEDVLPSLGFKLHAAPGTKMVEFVYEFPIPGGGRALVANDIFGSAHAADDSRLLGRLIVSHIAVPGHRLGIPRIYRWRFITDIAAMRKFAGDLATIPDLRLITVSHGDPVTTAPADALRSVAAGSGRVPDKATIEHHPASAPGPKRPLALRTDCDGYAPHLGRSRLHIVESIDHPPNPRNENSSPVPLVNQSVALTCR